LETEWLLDSFRLRRKKRVIPNDLQNAFDNNKTAFNNYQNFAPSYKKSYLCWLKQAKKEVNRDKRIKEIISFCEQNIKFRETR
jgi:uncharacterized protein YdeI (YjbR/CyaY-like superfamily)